MSLDSTFLYAFLLTVVRCGAMLFSSPLFGGQVPATIRVAITTVVSLSLTPVVAPYIGPMPSDTFLLVGAVAHEALVGILIGASLQFLMLAAQMAGSFLDLQVGFSMAQIFNPISGSPTTLLANFKYMLAIVLLLLMNGHHMMFQAFVESYRLGNGLEMGQLTSLKDGLLTFIGELSLLALQISAPVAAVCVIVDVAAGIVNKAVPQMQAYLVSLPAKILVGVVALSLALPLMVVAVQNGVEHTLETVLKMVSGRGG